MTVAHLIVGHGYYLSGMHADMWGNVHPHFGRPEAIAARYLGWLQGVRRWHGFEVWKDEAEQGVLFMSSQDLARLTVRPIITE
jgi:hypothetical protein